MFLPNYQEPKQGLQNAIFDYLNRNPHKFDEYGNFDARPDERDYIPSLLLNVSSEEDGGIYRKPPQYVRPQRAPGQAPQRPLRSPWAEMLRNVKKREAEIRKFYADKQKNAKEGHKYDSDDCSDYFSQMVYRCKRDFEDNPYLPDEYQGCVDRAKSLRDYCFAHEVFPEGLMEWGEEDMDIVDENEPRGDGEESKQERGPEEESPAYNDGAPADITSAGAKAAAELSMIERFLRALVGGGRGGGGGGGFGGGGGLKLHPKYRHLQFPPGVLQPLN